MLKLILILLGDADIFLLPIFHLCDLCFDLILQTLLGFLDLQSYLLEMAVNIAELFFFIV